MPAEIEITRNVSLNISVNSAFSNVADFKNWAKWNPWSSIDKNTTLAYSDQIAEVGSSFIWTSDNPNVGNVNREIIKIENNKSITNKMTVEGRQNSSETWTFSESGQQTDVSWTIKFRLGFFFRVLAPIINLKLGSIMEDGLDNMASLYSSQDETINLKIVQETLPSQMYVIRRGNAPHNDPVAISTSLRNAYTELMDFSSYFNLIVVGPPVAINIEWGDNYVFDAGLPIADVRVPQGSGSIRFINITDGKVVKGIYTGPYEKIAPAYKIIEKYIDDNNLKTDGNSWEQYISDPQFTPRDSLVTFIFFPVK
jgi:hypothetical protein